ncbi:hypothetical protein [Streptomyces scopuliridis]|uniref:hypothetical protein n=1 Tax=Streptomyces scopuliridis TaxID=452529 RepID=UPI0004C1BD03|nr:hypothetical protein [Streptomyces scopuliridis]
MSVPDPVASPAAVVRASDVVMVAVVDADRARTAIDGEGGPLSDGVPQRPAGMRTEIREVEFLRCEEMGCALYAQGVRRALEVRLT